MAQKDTSERQLPELAIGWADEMTDEEKFGKFISGGAVYDTQEDELQSVNPETGFLPTDPQSMGENWEAIQQAALDRGSEE